MKRKGLFPRLWRRIKRIFFVVFFLQLFSILLLRWVDPPITMTQLISWISGDGMKRDYVSTDEISSNAKLAVIASEDQLFTDHEGFDWKSIKKAMEYNKRKPNRIRGASTISQQVAKNVFLWQGRGWFRKGMGVYFTFLVEVFLGKERILDVYLNTIEMGDGIFGIEAAAKTYFNKHAKNLTRQEAAMIAACLPNPKRYKVKPLSGYVANRSQWILQQMSFLEPDQDIQRVIK